MAQALKGVGQFLLALLIGQALVFVGGMATGFITGWRHVPLPTPEQDQAIALAFSCVIWTALCIGSWLGKRWEWMP